MYKKNFRIFKTVLLATVLSAAIFSTQAQTQKFAAVGGGVNDANGAAVTGAVVTLTKTEGVSTKMTVISDDAGRFRFERVAFGDYTMTVGKAGFKTARRDAMAIQTENPPDFNMSLEVGSVANSVVVVSVSRIEEELKNAPASISVVTRSEIENREVRSAGYELVGQPSVFVPQYYEGAYTSVVIRGVPERHHNDTFLALVDGIPFVTAGDEVELEFIPIDIVERVELVRGPTSALYGRGGVAGAVNYLTRPVPETFEGTIGLQYGSYNFVRPNFSVSFPISEKRSFLYLNGSFEHKDGWRDGTQRNAGNFLIKNQWNINQKNALTSYASYNRFRQGIGGSLPVRLDGSIVSVRGGDKSNTNIDNSINDRDSAMVATTLNTAFTPKINLRTVFQYRQNATETNLGFYGGFNEPTSEISFIGFHAGARAKTFFVEPQLSWVTKRFRFVGGAAYEQIRGFNTENYTGELGFNPVRGRFLFYTQIRNYLTGEFTNRANWSTNRLLDARSQVGVVSGYAQGSFDVTSKFFVTVGGRYDHFKRRVNFAAIVGGPASEATDADGHFSPKVSLSYRLTPNVTSYASFGEGYSPGFGPVWAFGNRNVNLKPEVARNFEVGVRGNLMHNRLYLSATGYRLQRRDLILLVTDLTTNRATTVNVGKQQSTGFEFESKYDLSELNDGLSTYFNYSYTDSEWIDNRFTDDSTGAVVNLSGKKVTGVPNHIASFGLGKTFRKGINLRGWFDFAGNYFIDTQNTVRQGRNGLLNASINIPFKDGKYDFRLSATNLLNANYHYFIGFGTGPIRAFPGLPLQLTGSFRYRF